MNAPDARAQAATPAEARSATEPASAEAAPVPVMLLTGFLGAGKTTCIRRIVERSRGRRLAFIVNEFASVDVDAAGLRTAASEAVQSDADQSDAADRVVAIPGGSIFCRCLFTTFLTRLEELAEARRDGRRPLDGVIIEASGIADPRVIRKMIVEAGLDDRFEIRQLVTLVDPGTLPRLVKTLPNIHAQIEAADLALLNKTDLFDEAAIRRTEDLLGEINPTLRVIRTRLADADFELFPEAADRPLEGELALCSDPRFDSLSIPDRRRYDVDALLDRLRRSAERIFRVKGTLLDARGRRVRFDGDATEPRIEPVDDEAGPGRLVVILDPEIRSEIKAAFEAAAVDEARPVPAQESPA